MTRTFVPDSFEVPETFAGDESRLEVLEPGKRHVLGPVACAFGSVAARPIHYNDIMDGQLKGEREQRARGRSGWPIHKVRLEDHSNDDLSLTTTAKERPHWTFKIPNAYLYPASTQRPETSAANM